VELGISYEANLILLFFSPKNRDPRVSISGGDQIILVTKGDGMSLPVTITSEAS